MGKKCNTKVQEGPKATQGGKFMIFPVEREFPPGQMAMHSNHFVIINDGPEFQLLFFRRIHRSSWERHLKR